MRRKWFRPLVLLVLGIAIISGCGVNQSKSDGSSSADQSDKKIITIGVNPNRDSIIKAAEPYLNSKGYKIQIKVIADPVQLNEAVNDGSIDLNFQQHELYMDQFNKNKHGNLAVVGGKLYNQEVGLFSKKYTSLDQFQDGDQITLQNDDTNRDRGLKLLNDCHLITLDPNAKEPYGLNDIKDNPKNLDFVEVSGETLVNSFRDTDGAVLNGMNVAKAGLTLDKALATYNRDDKEKYAVILAAKKGNENSKWAKAVYEALKQPEVIKEAKKVSNGTWTPAFDTETK